MDKRALFSTLRVVCIVVISFLVSYVAVSIYAQYQRVNNIEHRLEFLEKSIVEDKEEFSNDLHNIKQNINQIKEYEFERIEKEKEHAEAIETVKNMYLSDNVDLCASKVALTAEDMDRIINKWEEKTTTRFSGKGHVFIEASNQSGLNPIYIFAIAALESGFGKSHFAVERNNYFGINAVDSNPNLAYNMGDTLDEGIINGANWIKRNYYDRGYVTLSLMHDEGGYTDSEEWIPGIVSIANTSVSYL